MKTPNRAVTLSLVAMVVAGCGGGVDSGGTGAAPAVSQGVITAKGSIFVNGIEYSTAGASIKVDDISVADDSFLKEGMVVTVRGTSDDATRKGTATQVEARDILEGTIQSAPGLNTLTVMGQTVRIEDNVTRLNDSDAQKTFAQANFQAGEHVEVHGFPDDQGGVRATRVFRILNVLNREFESKGFVTGLVTGLGAGSFGLALTSGGASAVTVNFTAGQLPAGTANGSFVEVKSATAPSGGNVTASLIHLEDKIGDAGEKVEVEGIVTSGTLDSFLVNGKQVVTSPSTLFEGGAGGVSGDFSIGVKLEAEGPLDSNGAIAAAKISFRSNIKIEGIASNVTPTGLTVLGKSVAINQFTQHIFVNGDHVEVRALSDRNGNLIATRIGMVGNPGRAFLQGPISAADGTAGTLTLLGTSIVSDNTTVWRVSSTTTEAAVSKAEFFAQVRASVSVVKVKWDTFTATTAPIKEAEIEIGK